MTTTTPDTSAPRAQVLHTACTLDCPDACSLAVTVSDGRITGVDAGPGNPYTDGWICAKVKRHGERVHSPLRVPGPLVRTGPKGAGEFRSTTWDEALGLVAARIRSAIDGAGPEAVVPFTYNSSAATLEAESLTEAFFGALGASRVLHTICAATIGASWLSVYGSMASADPLDVVHSELVVIWGANPTVSNSHFPPLVNQAVRDGASLVVIDPRRTPMARRADLHLAVRPGTDVVLALAIAHLWATGGGLDTAFLAEHAEGVEALLAAAEAWPADRAAEVCGVPEADVRALATMWSSTRPAMLRIGWGPERNSNGGAACRAILALPVLGGHFGARGAGVVYATRTDEVRPRQRWPEFERVQRRTLNMHQIGQWLAPGAGDPCRVLFVQGANPAVMCPDQRAVHAALSREDVFTVVHDQVLTDTTRYADVVLPATTSFEIDDVATSYGSMAIQPVRAVVPRVGDSRSNDEVGLGLARAMGMDWAASPVEQAAPDPGPRMAHLPTQFGESLPYQGRARLVDGRLGAPRYVPVEADEPLALISPATSKLVNSVFGEFQSPAPTVRLHPDEAAARGLRDGQEVRVFNAAGSVVATLTVGADTRPGVAVMAKGVWLREYADGAGVNVLTPATGDPLIGGACFNDARVDVAAV
jgi:anaerobic selenocysteine-containing dehydrogenase